MSRFLMVLSTGYAFTGSRQMVGGLLLAVSIIIWGANWPVMKMGLEYVGPLWFSALRFLTGGLCLFAFQLCMGHLKKPSRQDLPLLLSVGILQMMLFTALGSIAMTQIEAGRAAVLAYTTPLWVTPAAVLLFGERLGRSEQLGFVLGIVGVLILFSPVLLQFGSVSALLPYLLLLGASLCWAICILHLKYSRSVATAYQLAPWQMLLAALPLCLIAAWQEGILAVQAVADFSLILLYVGPLATAFCFVAVNAASRWLSSTRMSSSMLGVPVVGLLLSVLILGETLTLSLAMGALAILMGILLMTCSPATK